MNFRQHIHHNYLLFGGSLLLFLVSYQLAINKTVQAWKLNKKLQSQVNNVSLMEQPAYIDRQNKILQVAIKAFKVDTVNYRNNVLTQIAEAGDREQVRIVEVPMQANLSTKQYLVQKITLRGNFFALLKTLNRLPKLNGVGYVRSVSLKEYAAPEMQKGSKDLILDIFTEVVKNH